MLTPREALIRGKNNQRVLVLAGILQCLQHSAHTLVNRAHAFVVLLDPVTQRPTGNISHAHRPQLTHLALYRHAVLRLPMLHLLHVLRLARAWRIHVLGHGRLGVLVIALVTVSRRKWSVHGAVAEPEIPRLLLVRAPFAVNELNRPVGVIVGGVPLHHLGFAAVKLGELIVIIIRRILHVLGPVPYDLVIPIAPETAIHTGMPLADLPGHIAVLAKDGRPKRTLVRIICAARILTLHTHGLDAVLVMTGQHRRARRHTPRTDVCLLKPHARGG